LDAEQETNETDADGKDSDPLAAVDLTLRLPREEYPHKKLQLPNKWRRSILSLIQILANGTKLVWQAYGNLASNKNKLKPIIPPY